MGRFQTLDGLRGVAALAVVLFHIAGWTNHNWAFPHAWLAVDFFFMLSGFVLAYAYEDRLARIGLLGFVRARFIRLWPLIALSMVLGAVGWVLVFHRSGAAYYLWQGAFLIPQLSGQPYPLNSPAWSLFFEIAANLAWAPLALKLNTRALLAIIVVSGALALGFSLPYAELGGPRAFLGGFPRVAFAYGLGVLCYRNRVSLSAPAWALAVILVAIFWLPNVPSAVNLAIVGLVFPVILLAGAGSRSDGLWLRLSGEMSYPLYVLHWPLGFALLPFLRPHGHLAVLSVVPLILIVAWTALKLYDEPVRRWLAAISANRPAAPRALPAELPSPSPTPPVHQPW